MWRKLKPETGKSPDFFAQRVSSYNLYVDIMHMGMSSRLLSGEGLYKSVARSSAGWPCPSMYRESYHESERSIERPIDSKVGYKIYLSGSTNSHSTRLSASCDVSWSCPITYNMTNFSHIDCVDIGRQVCTLHGCQGHIE